jgi:hypothetical protein
MKLSTANPQQIHSLKKRESAWFNNNLLRTNSQESRAQQKNRRADPGGLICRPNARDDAVAVSQFENNCP